MERRELNLALYSTDLITVMDSKYFRRKKLEHQKDPSILIPVITVSARRPLINVTSFYPALKEVT